MVIIILYLDVFYLEVVEILNVGVEGDGGDVEGFLLDDLFAYRNMAVVDMSVRYDVDELACFQSRYLSEHFKKNGVLSDVPVVGDEHILTALIEDTVEGIAGDVESHRIGARIKIHLVKILEIVDIGHYSTGGRIIFEVKKDSVDLIELALFILMFDAQLIAVSLADGAVFSYPLIPDMRMKVGDSVGLLLPYPKKLVDGVDQIGLTKSDYRKLVLKIVSIDETELFNRMRGRAVLPSGSDGAIVVTDAVGQNIFYVFDKHEIGFGHIFLREIEFLCLI